MSSGRGWCPNLRGPRRRGRGVAGDRHYSGPRTCRGRLAARLPGQDRECAPLPRSARERVLAGRVAAAYADDDIDGVVALLTDDAWFTMPPVTLEYQGPAAIAAFLRSTAVWREARGYRLVATGANRQPAFGLYVEDSSVASRFLGHGMIVLTLRGDRISAITRFIDEA